MASSPATKSAVYRPVRGQLPICAQTAQWKVPNSTRMKKKKKIMYFLLIL
jgi:hypothetical protein